MDRVVLQKLGAQARRLVSLETYETFPSAELLRYAKSFERPIPLDPLLSCLAEAKRLFAEHPADQSDGWLAPRVHATLRLSRREAADMEVWEFLTLAIPEVREYVLWRWATNETLRDPKRIFGSDRRNALARLWWVAELTRNGKDYAVTETAFQVGQDLINYITDVAFAHNRPAAIAYVLECSAKDRTAKQAVDLGKALNHVLSTLSLDTLVPDTDGDDGAYGRWLAEEPDATLMMANLPEGPEDVEVDPEAIERVRVLLRSLASAGGHDAE